MPFEKGHPYYPAKDGVPHPTKASAKRGRAVVSAVRERVDPHTLVEWHVRRAMACINVRWAEDEDGEIFVTWDDQGIPPSSEQIAESIKWLADRGWGLPAQSIHLEADFRAHLEGDTVPIGTVPAAVLAGIRSLLRPAAGELPPAPSTASAADVIDAEIVHEEPAPTVAEGAAPAPAAPADAPAKAP